MNEQRQNSMLLDALTCRGVLASVNIRYWRARKKLTPEDLGLSCDKVDDRLISLGHKKLLPREKLQRLALVEGRAHSTLEENSFPFLGGIARYVPNERLVLGRCRHPLLHRKIGQKRLDVIGRQVTRSFAFNKCLEFSHPQSICT